MVRMNLGRGFALPALVATGGIACFRNSSLKGAPSISNSLREPRMNACFWPLVLLFCFGYKDDGTPTHSPTVGENERHDDTGGNDATFVKMGRYSPNSATFTPTGEN